MSLATGSDDGRFSAAGVGLAVSGTSPRTSAIESSSLECPWAPASNACIRSTAMLRSMIAPSPSANTPNTSRSAGPTSPLSVGASACSRATGVSQMCTAAATYTSGLTTATRREFTAGFDSGWSTRMGCLVRSIALSGSGLRSRRGWARPTSSSVAANCASPTVCAERTNQVFCRIRENSTRPKPARHNSAGTRSARSWLLDTARSRANASLVAVVREAPGRSKRETAAAGSTVRWGATTDSTLSTPGGMRISQRG